MLPGVLQVEKQQVEVTLLWNQLLKQVIPILHDILMFSFSFTVVYLTKTLHINTCYVRIFSHFRVALSSLEILALSYGPGPFIIRKNFWSQICSRTIFVMHTAPGACLLCAPGAVCFSIMVLEHYAQHHKSRSKSTKSFLLLLLVPPFVWLFFDIWQKPCNCTWISFLNSVLYSTRVLNIHQCNGTNMS